jgi:hypothetical protein
MLRHRIEREDVAKVDDEEDQDVIEKGKATIEADDRWQRELFNAIGRANSCVAVRYSQGNGFVGHKSDIEISHYLWDHLRREVDRLTKECCRGWDRPARKSFRLGVVHTVSNTLQQGAATESSSKGTTGLEIILSRRTQVDAWTDVHMKLGKGRALRRLDLDPVAYQDGRAAGATIAVRKGLEAAAESAPLPAPRVPRCVEGPDHTWSPWVWTGQNYERECSTFGCTHKETAGKVQPIGVLKSAEGSAHTHEWEPWRSIAGALKYRRRCHSCSAHMMTEDLSV